MNGLEFSSIVRAADRCALKFLDSIEIPTLDHPHSIQRQLRRESPSLPGRSYICMGEQMVSQLREVLDSMASILLDPGLRGIWEWHRPQLVKMASQFFAPAKHFPVTVAGHTMCWTDQCIAQAFHDTEIAPPRPVTRRWYRRDEPVKLRLNRKVVVSLDPGEFEWLLPAGLRPREADFVKTRLRHSVFAAPGGRWFNLQRAPEPGYVQRARTASYLFGDTYRERLAPTFPARDRTNWLKLGLDSAIRDRTYDLFVHHDAPSLGTDLGRLTVVPSAADGSAPTPDQHDPVCRRAILDLSVLNLRRLMPATVCNISGVSSEELSFTVEPQRGLIAGVSVKRQWFSDGDPRRGLNAGEVARLEPFL